MPTTNKVLGQVNPNATTLTTLYTVPSNVAAVCSTISICNQASTSATFRIAIRPAGAALAASQYLVYDGGLSGNDSIFLTLGITLATTDIVSVYASSATVSFSLFGAEIS